MKTLFTCYDYAISRSGNFDGTRVYPIFPFSTCSISDTIYDNQPLGVSSSGENVFFAYLCKKAQKGEKIIYRMIDGTILQQYFNKSGITAYLNKKGLMLPVSNNKEKN